MWGVQCAAPARDPRGAAGHAPGSQQMATPATPAPQATPPHPVTPALEQAVGLAETASGGSQKEKSMRGSSQKSVGNCQGVSLGGHGS